MDAQTILIVDDEDAVLTVLKNSLTGLGQEYRILTAREGKEALQYLEKYRIDLIITDYRMSGMNGLELLEMTHNLQPNTRVIFITAFGSDEVEAEVNRLKAFAYLNKPIDLGTFRSIVKQAFGDLDVSRPGVVIHTDSTNSQITKILQSLKKTVDATCVLLIDTFEGLYITIGDIERSKKEKLVTSINTALKILDRAGTDLNDDQCIANQLVRQGTYQDLFAGRVDRRRILIVLTRHEMDEMKNKHAVEIIRKTVSFLGEKFNEAGKAEQKWISDPGFNQAVQTELDKIFSDEFDGTFASQSPSSTQKGNTVSSQFTMSYEEALAVGLILPTSQFGSSPEHTGGNRKA